MRLTVNTNHTSWEDDSTGPKGENTEEAEVKYSFKYFLNEKYFSTEKNFSDNQKFVEAELGNLWSGGLSDSQNTGGDGGTEDHKQENHQIRYEVNI